jgi:oligopeptide transport system substrate-binding protein
VSGCGLFQKGSGGGTGLAENQVLRLAESGELSTLDSAVAKDVVSFNILNNVMEGLMRQGKGKQPEPGIAMDYEVSPDKKKYTFKLREDATWSDGKPVTAHDFEYAWKRALDPKTASEYAYILFPIKNAAKFNANKAKASDVGVRAKDDHTLEVTLEKPTLNFLSLTTTGTYLPQRKDIVEKFKNSYGTKPDTLVYNGPFKVSSWTPSKIELVKNENYWDTNGVTLEKVEVHVVKDPATAMNLYTAGKLDVAPLSSALADAFNKTQEFNTVQQAAVTYIMFNHKKSFFKNEKIRKAISLAIDRESITQYLLKDGSKPAGSLVPPAINGVGNASFRSTGEVVTENAAMAKELFKQGLKELGLSKPPADIEMISYDSSPRKDVAQQIKEQLRNKLGLVVKLNSPPWKAHIGKVSKGEYDMAMLGWLADYDDPMTFFDIWESNNQMNWINFKNASYDALVEKAKQETDPKKYYNLLVEAEKILVGTDDKGKAAIAPLYYNSESFMQKLYVRDLYRHSYGAKYSLKWAYIAKEKK